MNSTNLEYERLMREILLCGSKVSPRGLGAMELIAHRSVVNMYQPVVTIRDRKLNYRFMAAEARWILSGSNRVCELTTYVARMSEFSDDGVRLQGAYGPKFIEQVRYVIDSLKADKYTRQAVMTFWRENPRPSKDIPCTISLQFLIRNHKLNCVATMRSSDAWLGWPYDVFSFSMVSAYILLSLGDPTIGLGQLYLTAGSQHMYETNLKQAYDVTSGNSSLVIQPMSIHTFNSPDHLLTHLECVRDCSWGVMTNPFLAELENLNHHEPHHTASNTTSST